MDKRTLIFFVSLTFTLFLVNLYFSHVEEGRVRDWHEQHKEKQRQQQQELAKDLTRRTKKVDQLPVVNLYRDAETKVFATAGVLDGAQVIVITGDSPLPAQLYYVSNKNGNKPVSVRLQQSVPAGVPAVYAPQKGEAVLVGDLPEMGTYDLQMLTVEPHGVRVTLGEYRDGTLFLPAEDLSSDVEGRDTYLPGEHALVLRLTKQGYLPVAVYDKEGHILRPLSAFDHLGKVQLVIEETPKATAPTTREYYVLENDYQQLVFSNIGGALVEVNFPFASATDKLSDVLEIETDRRMVDDHPQNAYFPAHPYFSSTENGQGPYQKVEAGKLGGYYPLLRRDLIGSRGEVLTSINPHYYAANIVSEYPEVAERPYEVTHFDKESIVFESTLGRRKIKRTYKLNAAQAPYCVELTLEIEGDARGLWLTSGIPDVEMISGVPAPSLKYRRTRHDKGEVINEELPKDTLTYSSVTPDWLSNSNGFFGVIVDPLTEVDPGYKAMRVSNRTAPSRMTLLDSSGDGKEIDLPGYNLLLPLKSAGGTMKFRFYMGPYSTKMLEKVDATYADPATGYNPDYVGSQSFHGWFSFVSEPIGKFLLILMNGFYAFTGSWALSIVLLTVALRLMLYPLNAWSMRSAIAMQEIGPELQAINEKHKKDPKKAQMEIINLYRDRGVNPVSGCFPLLIQLPFLIAMFDVLKSTYELRGASFIPGWIDNLTSPDVLFTWTMPLPLIGNEFHLLPIILGLSMFVQQRMMSAGPTDPAQMTDQQRQARAMSTLMAPVFTILFYNFPSGLNIYWLSSTVLAVAQQWFMKRRMASQPKPVTKATVTTPAKKQKKG